MRDIKVIIFSTEYGTFELDSVPKSSNLEVNASLCERN